MEPLRSKWLMCLLVMISLMLSAEARKTYEIKDRIRSGHIKVLRPRVMAYDAEWCMFKDDNNKWCITADQDWKLSLNNEYVYQQTDLSATSQYYKQYTMYNTTQSLAWTSEFNLPKLYYSSLKVTMPEFTAGLRLEMFYWINSYAWCLNFVNFITPIKIQILVDNKLEECSKVIINCLDDWTHWTKIDAELLEGCTLSTGAEFTYYEYNPIVTQLDRYLLGTDTYQKAICWPGFTPFMQVDKYPDNMIYALH